VHARLALVLADGGGDSVDIEAVGTPDALAERVEVSAMASRCFMAPSVRQVLGGADDRGPRALGGADRVYGWEERIWTARQQNARALKVVQGASGQAR
jgi:class 3 adenylate cyclase